MSGPLLVGVSWRTPNSYRKAGVEQGTATFNFYKDRDILHKHAAPHGDEHMRAIARDMRTGDRPGRSGAIRAHM
jgi:hypothetical protein